MTKNLQKVIDAFSFDGPVEHVEPFGGGHINDTLLLFTAKGTQYILQKINTRVFTNLEALMDNIFSVTEYLKKRLVECGGSPNRETLTFIRTRDSQNYYNGAEGAWRAYRFQNGLMALNAARTPNDFYESGRAFGKFQSLLKDYPVETLHETIPHFHNTPIRMQQLQEAIDKNLAGRVDAVKEEIAFLMERAESTHIIMDLQKEGILPIRVTHNDTKLNNVLLDPVTGEGICVIDLDTVMPGQAIFDFGDAIRFGASTAAEDEQDLSKVHLDLNLFEAFAKGYLEGCNGALLPVEKDLMPTAAWMMTLENGARFLADYLNGDIYYKTAYPEHNLVRTRTHIKLVQEMEEKQDQMQAIIAKFQ